MEHAAFLAGLDETETTTLLQQCPAPVDLGLLEDEEIGTVTQQKFKRRRLLAIKEYVFHGNSLDNNTTMELVLKRLHQDRSVTPNGISTREDLVEALRAVIPRDNWAKTAATPLMSPGEFGCVEMQAANEANIVIQVEGVENEPSVFSPAQIAPIANSKDEQEVVAFFTGLLEALIVTHVSNSLALVNCEEYKWLSSQTGNSKYDEKPDLLLCHKYFFAEKTPSAAAPPAEAIRTSNFKFGILANRCLLDSVVAVFEAKVKIGADNASFGEVINYGRLLALPGSCHRKSTWQRVVLFDKIDFWLFFFNSGALVYVKKCPWTQPGSRKLLLDFVSHQSDWSILLDEACDAFGVTGFFGNSFLGFGAFGRVFRVRWKDPQKSGDADFALKIVLNNEAHNQSAADMMQMEHDYLCRARETAPQLVPEVFKTVVHRPRGSALLLMKVGRPITNIKVYFERVLLALVEIHKAGTVHGDPRIANAIIVERGRINWIDFSMARFHEQSVVRFRQDLEILLKSFFVSAVGGGLQLSIPQPVVTTLHEYEPNNRESVASLTAAIGSCLD